MTRSPHRLSEALAHAVITALAAARWHAADLASRRPPEIVPDLLSGRAAELACSPIADDQLLSLALDVAAQDVRSGRPALAGGVLSFFPARGGAGAAQTRDPEVTTDGVRLVRDMDLVADLEARRRSLGLSGAELSSRLAEDARLQDLLAEDPRIPADEHVRGLMRASLRPILERSRALDPNVLRAHARRARRRFRPFRPADADLDSLRHPPIVLGEGDRERLTTLAFDVLLSDPRAAAPLLQEIGRARVVADDQVPTDVARLGASVEYAELFAGSTDRVTLVASRPDRKSGSLSVLTSIGAALIGLSIGQTILWRDHVGAERLVTVMDVRFGGPERGMSPAAANTANQGGSL